MLLRKSTPGNDSFGNEWKTPKSVVEVPDWQGEQLLAIHDAGFSVVEPGNEGDPDGGRVPETQPDDVEHPQLYPATQSIAPAHAYADDTAKVAGEFGNPQWDALEAKRRHDEELLKIAHGEGERNDVLRRAVVDAQIGGGDGTAPEPGSATDVNAKTGAQVEAHEPSNADVVGDGEQADVLEPGNPTGVTAEDGLNPQTADATGNVPAKAKPRNVRGNRTDKLTGTDRNNDK